MMKRPDFMEGTPAQSDETGAPQPSAPRIKQVSWLPADREPAMPRVSSPSRPAPAPLAPAPLPAPAFVAAPPMPAVPAPVPSPPPLAPAFEALPSAPMPSAPPPPPRAPVVDESQRAAVRLAIEQLKTQGERLAEQARSDSLELAVLIAQRILEKEIRTDLAAIFSLIKSAIRRAGEEHVTLVRLHPDDVKAFADAASSSFSFGKIELKGDPSLSRGDVIVETEHHSIDGRLSTRLHELVKTLDGANG